ncbi:nucleoside triphosphate pyrophosphohydrolase [Peribacillus cavernae]|uniref:Nucleoside triphosphate pyrophosphohydrolase n=1 Tax=Peribacillus cavernae TaxID=1674310 RepID=A0A433HG07_9BACI|nr:nucleoside triphosphate pyrophosphohydrolase [Peribacillus cavernae]MDQ0220894.1 tetrapyrrole methylase family protein/MazG family protein [Peribacillus cavernae]RUQ27291.1 nucleoside triphosphate pyrophosphohydrolase [Peribacillus cavernae]
MKNDLAIIGLGAGDLDQLPLGVYKKLKRASVCLVRTIDHPVIKELSAEGVVFESFDEIYEKHAAFEAVYEEISEMLLERAERESVIYAVPGHPMVAEKTVQLLLEKGPERNISITIEGGHSFLDALFQAVKIDPIDGFQLLDGTALVRDDLHINQHMIIGQVYDSLVASEVKLTLMEKLPDEHEVYLVKAAGSKEEVVKKVVLYELDRQMDELSNLTSVYVPPVKNEAERYRDFPKLREIIACLRGPDGCPWDKKQTHASLKPYLIEEAYELIEAIDEKDDEGIIGELGDVLLQVMLHSQIAEDEGMFTIDDVIEGISAKMVRRHPHVFGAVKVSGTEEVLENWQKIKADEKAGETIRGKSLLDEVGKSLPALIRGLELQKRAAKVGFDWKDVTGVWDKVKEEITELEVEFKKEDNIENIRNELGDLFFTLVNVARFYGIQAEEAMNAANRKFYNRFTYIESLVKQSGKSFGDCSLSELDNFWEEAKAKGY